MDEIKNDAFLSIYEMLQGKSVGIGFCDKSPDSPKEENNNKTTLNEKSEAL